MEAIVQNEIGELLGDSDLVEYVVGLLSEEPNEAESGEAVTDFIASAGGIEEDGAAAAASAKLFAALRGAGFGTAASDGGSSASTEDSSAEALSGVTRLLGTKVVIGSQDKTLAYGDGGDGNYSSTGASYNTAGTSTAELAANNHKTNKGKRRTKSAAATKADADTEAVEAELDAARVAAVHARTRLGAFNGALEASKFTLANPGGGQPLLEDASLTLVRGRRYGLIGRNGKGKSTLLRALAARRVGDVPVNVTVHYVSQEVKLTEAARMQTPGDFVIAADVERRELLAELAQLEAKASTPPPPSSSSADEAAAVSSNGGGAADADTGLNDQEQLRYAAVSEQLELINADSAERRAADLLKALGFTDELRQRPLKELSGGWRVRTALAAAIFAKPDLLLLDEPTNHLSIAAVLWLARELSQGDTWKDRTIVIVSHDRFFVDEVCGDVLHISGAAQRLTQTHANYTGWATKRAEQQAAYAKVCAARAAEAEKLQTYADHGFKYGGSTGQLNQMARKKKEAERITEASAAMSEELANLQEDMELPLQLLSGGNLPGFLVQLKDVSFRYSETSPLLFEGVEVSVTSTSRLVLLGENGNGKTTLLKVLLGELEPTGGDVVRASGARIALVNQHSADQLDLGLSPLEFMLEEFPAPSNVSSYDHALKLRSHLASCGVPGGNKDGTVADLQNLPIAAMSGGQRARVALAAVSYKRPHILVLDEPTNNLDLESVGALAESVKSFQGAVIVVSHDQFFVNEIANEAWVVGGCAVKRAESFEAYRKKELAKLAKTAM